MAYNPIAYTIPQYIGFENYWLKFYEPGTTTPKAMATDSTAVTPIARAEINLNGFPTTEGQTLFIPYVDGAYDLYAFPTELEADANDTINATKLADNVEPIGATEAVTQYIKTPMDYGAVGDGIADDTAAVQACLTAENYTMIDRAYAVTSVTIDKYCTCINGGKYVSLGPVNNRVVIITSEFVGDIVVDGNAQAVNCIYFPEGTNKKQVYKSLNYSNVRMVTEAQLICTGVTMFSEDVTGGPITGDNMDQNNYINRSFPQGLVTGGGVYHIERHYLTNGCAGFVPTGAFASQDIYTATGKSYIGENHTVDCTDNSAYLLGGYVNIGTNICETEEEGVQINAVQGCDIGRIVAVGRCLGAFNVQNTLGPVNIGEVVGAYPPQTVTADIPSKVPTHIAYVRPGNVDIGCQSLTVGSVKGYFQRGWALGTAGIGTRFTCRNVDVTLCYNPSASPLNQWTADPATNSWYNLEMWQEVNISNHRVRIKNFEATPFPTTSAFATEFRPTAINSMIENLDISLIENDDTIAPETVQVISTAPTAGIKVIGGYWTNSGANTRHIRAENAGYQRNSINNGSPVSGTWETGQILHDRNDGEDGTTIYKCTVGGSPGTWIALGKVIRDTIPANGTPEYVGQMFIQTNADRAWVAKDTSSVTDWVEIS